MIKSSDGKVEEYCVRRAKDHEADNSSVDLLVVFRIGNHDNAHGQHEVSSHKHKECDKEQENKDGFFKNTFHERCKVGFEFRKKITQLRVTVKHFSRIF